MRSLSVVVLGGGTAGLAACLALARDGHRVTLVERDPFMAAEPAGAIFWPRAGIPHFLQPHAFISRGRSELQEHFPDVYRALLDAGAADQDLRPKILGPLRPEDEVLAFLAASRPLIEWAMRRAVLAEPGIEVRSGTKVIGLHGERGDPPRVTGAVTSDGVIPADLVVNAMGRRNAVPAWLESLGGRPMRSRSTECGIIYYSRYYRTRDGATLPDGRWILSPRADLGYGAFSTFHGDNGTFAVVLAIPSGDQDLKLLRHAAAFEAAAEAMPALFSWANPDIAEPITDVMPMGSLQNTIRSPADGAAQPVGLVNVADAICHTDPVLALGLSLSLIHAVALRASIRDHGNDLSAIGGAFDAAIRPAMEERFAFASAVDDARSRTWHGETIDVGHRDGGAYEMFTLAAGSAAALLDGEVFRSVVRRNMFLDPLTVLDKDLDMQKLIERLFAQLMGLPRPAPGPPREKLIEFIRTALSR